MRSRGEGQEVDNLRLGRVALHLADCTRLDAIIPSRALPIRNDPWLRVDVPLRQGIKEVILHKPQDLQADVVVMILDPVVRRRSAPPPGLSPLPALATRSRACHRHPCLTRLLLPFRAICFHGNEAQEAGQAMVTIQTAFASLHRYRSGPWESTLWIKDEGPSPSSGRLFHARRRKRRR